MKKRLLIGVLTVMGAGSAFALGNGDYIFSNTDRFKVTGENIVVNGNFASGLDGWTDETGQAVDGSVWGFATEDDGTTAVQCTEQTSAEGKLLANSWTLPTGTYAVMYRARANASFVTSLTATGNNYVSFFVGEGTTVTRAISGSETIGTEWTQVVDTIMVLTDQEKLVFNAGGIPSGTVFTDVQIYPIESVYDIRIVNRLIAYAEKLLAEPDLQEGREDFAFTVDMLKSMIEDPAQNESTEAMEGLIESFNVAFDTFMNSNGGNTNSGDWTKRSSVGWNKLPNSTIIGSWQSFGGRWGFSANDASLERPANDGYVLSAGIQTSMDLSGVGVKVERTDLNPGKYFFAIEAQEVAASAKSSPYGANYSKVFVGPTIFIGTDTLVMRPATDAELEDIAAGISNKKYTEYEDTLNGYYWKRYYYIADVKEGETVQAGFIFPTYTDKRGGRASLRNPEFRMIGKTELQLNYESALKGATTQQTELKNRIDTYPGDVAALLWGQDAFNEALQTATATYENSLAQIDADGNCNIEVTEEGVAELQQLEADLLAQVKAMNTAKNTIVNLNAIQDDLRAAIAEGQAELDNPLNAGGDATLRAALQEKVAEAQALIDGISSVDQHDEFALAIENINKAIEVFKISCANRANPAEIGIVNGDFAKNSGNSTTSTQTNNGWNYAGSGTFKQWQWGGPSDGWEGSKTCNQWRGYTVTLGGKVQQAVTLTEPGIYEYRALAYGTNDNLAYRMGTATILYDENEVANDTTYFDTPMRLFFGLDGRPDSIVVSKCIAPGANGSAVANRPWQNINGVTPWHYSVYYVKTSTEAETIEFGMEVDPLDVGKGLNSFGFGANKIYYLGNADNYLADTKAVVSAEVAKAEALAAQNAESEDFAWLVVKLNRYIADAKAATDAKGLQNAWLSMLEIENLIESNTQGIEAAFAQPAVAVKGIYTLSGMKVAGDASTLKPGFYIINGKKYVVK